MPISAPSQADLSPFSLNLAQTDFQGKPFGVPVAAEYNPFATSVTDNPFGASETDFTDNPFGASVTADRNVLPKQEQAVHENKIKAGLTGLLQWFDGILHKQPKPKTETPKTATASAAAPESIKDSFLAVIFGDKPKPDEKPGFGQRLIKAATSPLGLAMETSGLSFALSAVAVAHGIHPDVVNLATSVPLMLDLAVLQSTNVAFGIGMAGSELIKQGLLLTRNDKMREVAGKLDKWQQQGLKKGYMRILSFCAEPKVVASCFGLMAGGRVGSAFGHHFMTEIVQAVSQPEAVPKIETPKADLNPGDTDPKGAGNNIIPGGQTGDGTDSITPPKGTIDNNPDTGLTDNPPPEFVTPLQKAVKDLPGSIPSGGEKGIWGASEMYGKGIIDVTPSLKSGGGHDIFVDAFKDVMVKYDIRSDTAISAELQAKLNNEAAVEMHNTATKVLDMLKYYQPANDTEANNILTQLSERGALDVTNLTVQQLHDLVATAKGINPALP